MIDKQIKTDIRILRSTIKRIFRRVWYLMVVNFKYYGIGLKHTPIEKVELDISDYTIKKKLVFDDLCTPYSPPEES